MEQIKDTKYRMDFMEKITLSPIEKYIRFNKFPWKLLVHVALLIFTTAQVYSVIGLRGDHNRSIHQSLKYIIFEDDGQENKKVFQTLTDFQEHLKKLTSQLYNLNDFIYQDIDIKNSQFMIQVQYLTVDQKNIKDVIFNLNLKEGIKQPFDVDDIDSIRQFMNQVSSFNIIGNNLYFKTYYQNNDSFDKDDYYCMNWSIKLNYNFESFASVIVKYDTSSHYCNFRNAKDLGHSYLLVHLIVLVLSFVSLILSGKYVYEIAKDYMHYMTLYKKVIQLVDSKSSITNFNSQNQDEQTEKLLQFKETWEELSIFDKLKFFDFWFLFGIIGHFVQINASIICILFIFVKQKLSIFSLQESMVGVGCGFSWLLMLKYLEYNPNINIMTSTLRKSSNNIFKFFLGVFPVFIAFCLFAQCLFWKYEQFQSLNGTIIILFSLSYGDIVYDTFRSVVPEGFIGQAFLIFFMLLFYTAVQNVFITIIMDGYEKTRQEIKVKKNIKKYGENYKAKMLEKNSQQIQGELKQILQLKEQSQLNKKTLNNQVSSSDSNVINLGKPQNDSSSNSQANKVWKSDLHDIQEQKIENTLQISQNQYEIEQDYINLDMGSDKKEFIQESQSNQNKNDEEDNKSKQDSKIQDFQWDLLEQSVFEKNLCDKDKSKPVNIYEVFSFEQTEGPHKEDQQGVRRTGKHPIRNRKH